jgi:hypothetical protein
VNALVISLFPLYVKLCKVLYRGKNTMEVDRTLG